MENITIGDIVAAIGIISVIGAFISTIVVSTSKWYKKRITDSFERVHNRIDKVEDRMDKAEDRLTYVESKRDEYEREVINSKHERMILLKGELSALKILNELYNNDLISESIDEIELYMMERSHGFNTSKK